jgi:hypothetical protein
LDQGPAQIFPVELEEVERVMRFKTNPSASCPLLPARAFYALFFSVPSAFQIASQET